MFVHVWSYMGVCVCVCGPFMGIWFSEVTLSELLSSLLRTRSDTFRKLGWTLYPKKNHSPKSRQKKQASGNKVSTVKQVPQNGGESQTKGSKKQPSLNTTFSRFKPPRWRSVPRTSGAMMTKNHERFVRIRGYTLDILNSRNLPKITRIEIRNIIWTIHLHFCSSKCSFFQGVMALQLPVGISMD